MSDERHRIHLRDFDPERHADGWVDIPPYRTFGMRLQIQEAGARSIADYSLKKAELYVLAWSFDEAPSTAAFQRLEEHIAAYILDAADEHYASQQRSDDEGKA